MVKNIKNICRYVYIYSNDLAMKVERRNGLIDTISGIS